MGLGLAAIIAASAAVTGIGISAASSAVQAKKTGEQQEKAAKDLEKLLAELGLDPGLSDDIVKFAFSNENVGSFTGALQRVGGATLGFGGVGGGSPLGDVTNIAGQSGLSKTEFERATKAAQRGILVFQNTGDIEAAVATLRGDKGEAAENAIAALGYADPRDFFIDAQRFNEAKRFFGDEFEKIRPDVQLGQIMALSDIAQLQQNFEPLSIAQREGANINFLTDQASRRKDDRDEQILQQANALGFNPGGLLSQSQETFSQEQSDIENTLALSRAIQEATGQAQAFSGQVGALQNSLGLQQGGQLAQLFAGNTNAAGSLAAQQAINLNALRAQDFQNLRALQFQGGQNVIQLANQGELTKALALSGAVNQFGTGLAGLGGQALGFSLSGLGGSPQPNNSGVDQDFLRALESSPSGTFRGINTAKPGTGAVAIGGPSQ